MKSLLGLLLFPLLFGCSFWNSPCLLVAYLRMSIAAVDKRTEGVITDNLSGLIRDRSYVEDLMRGRGDCVFGCSEGARVYKVKVTASKYTPWFREKVEVKQDRCHVFPVSLTAHLTPSSPFTGNLGDS